MYNQDLDQIDVLYYDLFFCCCSLEHLSRGRLKFWKSFTSIKQKERKRGLDLQNKQVGNLDMIRGRIGKEKNYIIFKLKTENIF